MVRRTGSSRAESTDWGGRAARRDNSARVQGKLVDDLLDVSRIVTGKLSIHPVDTELVGTVRAAVDAIRITAAGKKIEISTDLPDRPIPIKGDPDLLQQIVLNLLSNTLKFTPEGGTISVAVKERRGEADIIVADTGEGITPEFLPHVFDRFRQASIGYSRKYTGLGLGLSIVQHLVHLHGGHVRAESDGLGKGARFTVTLPT